MSFIWQSFYETGIPEVDQQHRRLVDMINAAAPLVVRTDDQAKGEFGRLFDQLAAYAVEHFSAEEGLMRSTGLDQSYQQRHVQHHAEFVAQVVELRAQLDDEQLSDIGASLLRFLTGWLTFHILDDDQKMAAQMRSVKAGKSPAAALSEASSPQEGDQARLAMTNALVELYAVIGARNRALRHNNEQLKSARRQLEETNQSLEERIAERTASLKEALARMEQTHGQLLQSEKMAAIGQLAAGVAHEINNPVGFVNSNLGTLRRYVDQLLALVDAYDSLRADIAETDSRRQAIDEARKAADIDYLKDDIVDLLNESAHGLGRVKKIVQDLKDFSHAGKAEWQEANLNEGIDSTLNVIWNEIKYKATVNKHFGELPPITCVPSQINQVFMNLLVNAAQAIKGNGVIDISTGALPDGVWVEIKDNGAGMPEAVRNRIFEPFFTTKPVGKGTGLGLSISWDIVVKTHGGRFAVTSEEGQGTCFRIELPIQPPLQDGTTAAPAVGAS
jgi:two-component system NtrC family sensor kinase